MSKNEEKKEGFSIFDLAKKKSEEEEVEEPKEKPIEAKRDEKGSASLGIPGLLAKSEEIKKIEEALEKKIEGPEEKEELYKTPAEPKKEEKVEEPTIPSEGVHVRMGTDGFARFVKEDKGVWRADLEQKRRVKLDELIKKQLKPSGNEDNDNDACDLLNYYKPQAIVNDKGFLKLKDKNDGRMEIFNNEGEFDHITTTENNLLLTSHHVDEDYLDYEPIYIEERAFELLTEEKGHQQAVKELLEDDNENLFADYRRRVIDELAQDTATGASGAILQEKFKKFVRSVHRLRPALPSLLDGPDREKSKEKIEKQKLLRGNKGVIRAGLRKLVSAEDKRLRARDVAIRRLHRPRLARTLYMTRTTGDRLVDIMAYVPSMPKEDISKELTPRENTKEILLPLLEELNFLNSNYGILHRDLKPENIAYTRENGVVILDFGVARAKQESEITARYIIGSPVYMSPEHITGEYMDFRSDMYELGLTVHNLITGERPYDTKLSPEEIWVSKLSGKKPFAITHKRFRDLLYRDLEEKYKTFFGRTFVKPVKRFMRKRFLKNLELVLSRMCQFQSEDRYNSYQECIEDVKAILKGGFFREILDKPPHMKQYLKRLRKEPTIYKGFGKGQDTTKIGRREGFVEKAFELGKKKVSEEARIAKRDVWDKMKKYVIPAVAIGSIVLYKGCESLVGYLWNNHTNSEYSTHK